MSFGRTTMATRTEESTTVPLDENKKEGWLEWSQKKIVNAVMTPKLKEMSQQLEEEKQKNDSLEKEMAEHARIHEGQFGTAISVQQARRMYYHFFTQVVDDMVAKFPPENRKGVHQVLCNIFQQTFDYEREMVQRQLQQMVTEVFETPTALTGEPRKLHDQNIKDMKLAYTRLLLASGFTEECPIGYEALSAKLKVKELSETSNIDKSELKKFVVEATKLSWSLLTSAPPYLVGSPDQFDKMVHDRLGSDEYLTGKHELQYLRPVLYTSCLGEVGMEGRVKVLETTDATPPSPDMATPQTDGTQLSLENTMAEMTKGVFDWYSVGIELGISEEELQKLGKGKTWEKEVCLRNMITIWLQQQYHLQGRPDTIEPPWESLCSALRKAGEDENARRIEKKYLKGQEASTGEPMDQMQHQTP